MKPTEQAVLAEFGARLKNARVAGGISQGQLAIKAAINRNYVGSVERGERNVCLLNIVRLARALKVPAKTFLEGL